MEVNKSDRSLFLENILEKLSIRKSTAEDVF